MHILSVIFAADLSHVETIQPLVGKEPNPNLSFLF